MSVPVDVKDLAAHVGERGGVAYLLSVSDDGRPHAVGVSLVLREGRFEAGAGRRTCTNVRARPMVSLLWAARTADDYSLIVDGEAAIVGDGEEARVIVVATRAVLHRPAAPAAGTNADPNAGTGENSCGSDCLPLDIPTPSSSSSA